MSAIQPWSSRLEPLMGSLVMTSTRARGGRQIRPKVKEARYTKMAHECVSCGWMRTNIDIDDELLAEAAKVAGTKTKRATVEYALADLVRRKDRRAILRLKGKIGWEGDLDRSRASRSVG